MDLICPECRSILTVQGRTARCNAHGGEYEVLFDRETEALRQTSGSQAATTAAQPSVVCTNHPRTQAVYTCPKCSRPICTMCAFEVRGKQYCPDCATHAVSEPMPEPAPRPQAQWQPQPAAAESAAPESSFPSLGLTAEPPPFRVSVPPGMKCVQHKDVDAATRCRVCNNGMCNVCDFALPNGMHVCPACIENRGTDGIAPRRTYTAVGSIAIGLFAMIFFVLVAIASARNPEDQGIAMVGNIAVLVVCIVGVWLSFSVFEPALGNSPPIWIGVILNTAVLGLLVLASVVGVFMT